MKINECTSVWKESKKQQRQFFERIDLLLFPKQKQQKKEALQQEMEAEFRLEKEIQVNPQEHADNKVKRDGDNVDNNDPAKMKR